MEFISAYYNAHLKYQDLFDEMQSNKQVSSESNSSQGLINSVERIKGKIGALVNDKAQLSMSMSLNSQNENQQFRSISIKRCKNISPILSLIPGPNFNRLSSHSSFQSDNRDLQSRLEESKIVS